LSNADKFFIVADCSLGNIYQVDATSGTTAQLLPFGAASFPTGLAYDSAAKLLYWNDAASHTINRYSLLTKRTTVIYRDRNHVGKYTGLNAVNMQYASPRMWLWYNTFVSSVSVSACLSV